MSRLLDCVARVSSESDSAALAPLQQEFRILARTRYPYSDHGRRLGSVLWGGLLKRWLSHIEAGVGRSRLFVHARQRGSPQPRWVGRILAAGQSLWYFRGRVVGGLTIEHPTAVTGMSTTTSTILNQLPTATMVQGLRQVAH